MRKKNWFWGIVLVLGAVVLVASQVAGFTSFGIWTALASILLVAALLQSLIHKSFTAALFSGALLYIVWQKPLELFYINPWLLLVAALLGGIGLSIMFRQRPPAYTCGARGGYYDSQNPSAPYGEGCNNGQAGFVTHELPQNGGTHHDVDATSNGDDNNPYVKVDFGGATRFLHSTALQGGQFYISFGALDVYFDQAQISPSGAEIFIDVSFGACKLYVPRTWRVEESIHTSLSGVEHQNRHTAPDSDAPVLRINGNASFAGVSIIYV